MLTLTKIAAIANVSLSTASKAFSMSAEVSEETRNLIFDIAKKNGVFKKFYNAKYPKLVVGVICSDYNNNFYPDILKDIQEKLAEYGCDMSVASSNTSKLKEMELYDYYSMYTDVDAIITIGKSVELPSDFSMPRVDIEPLLRDALCPTVVMNYEAIRDGILYFHSKKIDSIGYLTFNCKSVKAWKFTKFMTELFGNTGEGIIEISDYIGGECGYKGIDAMIEKRHIPKVLFCEDDEVAFGAMRALCERGYKTPEDVAIVGWNDYPFAKYCTPSLSTINISSKQVISESVDMLIKTLSGQPCKKYIEIMSCFIERESSKI